MTNLVSTSSGKGSAPKGKSCFIREQNLSFYSRALFRKVLVQRKTNTSQKHIHIIKTP